MGNIWVNFFNGEGVKANIWLCIGVVLFVKIIVVKWLVEWIIIYRLSIIDIEWKAGFEDKKFKVGVNVV